MMIEIQSLAKRYPNNKGLGPIDMRIADGEVVGVVGPNGAGKTTFFNILAGIVEPDFGTVALEDGKKIARIPSPCLGFLQEVPYLPRSFTPRQACAFEAAMRGLLLSEEKIDETLCFFGCEEFLDGKIGRLSQGMAKRVALACAFIDRKGVIVLDEPLNALDIQTTIKVKDAIAACRNGGASVLVSSHVLHFVDEVADRIVFLDEGVAKATIDPHKSPAEKTYRSLFMGDRTNLSE